MVLGKFPTGKSLQWFPSKAGHIVEQVWKEKETIIMFFVPVLYGKVISCLKMQSWTHTCVGYVSQISKY